MGNTKTKYKPADVSNNSNSDDDVSDGDNSINNDNKLDDNLSSNDISLGDNVSVNVPATNKSKAITGTGVVRFYGDATIGRYAGVFVGVELTDGSLGKNDGLIEGKRYFTCKQKGKLVGLMVRKEHVSAEQLDDSDDESSTTENSCHTSDDDDDDDNEVNT